MQEFCGHVFVVFSSCFLISEEFCDHVFVVFSSFVFLISFFQRTPFHGSGTPDLEGLLGCWLPSRTSFDPEVTFGLDGAVTNVVQTKFRGVRDTRRV